MTGIYRNMIKNERYKMMNKVAFILFVFTLLSTIICNAKQDADMFSHQSAQEIIKYLNKSKHHREALSIRNSNIGNKAPAIHVEEWLGNEPSILKWPNGQVTIIEFWSMTCGPCIASIPRNNEITELITKRGGSFISIHEANEERVKIIKFLKENKIKYPVAIDPNFDRELSLGKTFYEYGVEGIPTYVTIGKNGNVLSYKLPATQDINDLFNNEEKFIDYSQKDLKIWALVSTPQIWIEENIEPESMISKNIFIYRPDTPELILKNAQPTDANITSEFIKHTAQEQTIYEVVLSRKTPGWGETIEGNVTFLGNYKNEESLVEIPYRIKSKGLVEYSSSTIHLGLVNKGQIVTYEIIFKSANHNRIEIKPIFLPEHIKVEIVNQITALNNIIVRLNISYNKVGLNQGNMKLLAFDNKGNKQNIDLKLNALVK